jgi:hypothetical protein
MAGKKGFRRPVEIGRIVPPDSATYDERDHTDMLTAVELSQKLRNVVTVRVDEGALVFEAAPDTRRERKPDAKEG